MKSEYIKLSLSLQVIVPLYMIYWEQESFPLHRDCFSAWILLSFGLWSAWHWLVMQGLAVVTLANVGHMLCPAYTDPFRGPHYRLIGIVHQFLAIAAMGGSVGLFGYCLEAAAAAADDDEEHKLEEPAAAASAAATNAGGGNKREKERVD